MGRPTKLDAATAERICTAVSLGAPWYLAAQAGGIAPSALREWKSRGRAGEEPYAAFVARLKSAEAAAVTGALEVIQKAAVEGTWQAAAWLLERRYPKSFGRAESRSRSERLTPSLTVDQARAKYKELTGLEWDTRTRVVDPALAEADA